MYDFTSFDSLYDAIFGCEYNPVGCTLDPAIVPDSGTIEMVSDDMEVVHVECDTDGNIVGFDYYNA